jgi:hypothetical protein
MYLDMDALEIIPRVGLFCVGVAAGVGFAELLDPVAPRLGRLAKVVATRFRRNRSD